MNAFCPHNTPTDDFVTSANNSTIKTAYFANIKHTADAVISPITVREMCQQAPDLFRVGRPDMQQSNPSLEQLLSQVFL